MKNRSGALQDTNTMAAQTTDYEITTSITPVDFIINVVAGYITVNCRTVTVRK